MRTSFCKADTSSGLVNTMMLSVGTAVRHIFARPTRRAANYCMYPSMWILPVAKFTVPEPQICRAFTHA